MTIHPNSREIRVECAWHDGIALAVVRVEMLNGLPLAWYLDHVDRARPSAAAKDRCALRVRAASGGAKWARTRRNRVAGSHRLRCPAPLPDLPIFSVI